MLATEVHDIGDAGSYNSCAIIPGILSMSASPADLSVYGQKEAYLPWKLRQGSTAGLVSIQDDCKAPSSLSPYPLSCSEPAGYHCLRRLQTLTFSLHRTSILRVAENHTAIIIDYDCVFVCPLVPEIIDLPVPRDLRTVQSHDEDQLYGPMTVDFVCISGQDCFLPTA